MAPIAIEAERRAAFDHRLMASGQQAGLFDQAISAFGLTIDYHLGSHLGGASHEAQVARIRGAVCTAFARDRPDLVLVQGDTNTALAGAQAAHALGIPLGHVEAGLRSGMPGRPFPEEPNRVKIAALASLHFAPSPSAAANLMNEGWDVGVCITGNPGIDALMLLRKASAPRVNQSGHILVTCHRRENFGVPLERICGAILALADQGARILWPLHSNPATLATICAKLGGHPRITLSASLTYPAMLETIRGASLVLSDSGGMQEECAALGVPLLLMREETERPEVVASGNCILVGSDPAKIVREAQRLSHDPIHRWSMSLPAFPYGHGSAAIAILDHIEAHFALNSTPFGFNSARYGTEMDTAELAFA